MFPQILFCHRVGSGALRIRRNRLPITEIDDDENNGNGNGNIQAIVDPSDSEGNQDSESRLGSVSSGAECIQSKDGNTGERSDAFLLIFAGSEWAAENIVEQSHNRF